MADGDWMRRFPGYKVINGEPRHSDHRPIIVVTEERQSGGDHWPASTFRFEANWVEEEQCASLVENAWKLASQVPGGTSARCGEECGRGARRMESEYSR